MVDPQQSSSPTRGSILYALGGLTQKVDDQGERLDAIPDRVLDGIAPRLNALEATSQAHDKRIGSLEKETWVTRGGVGLVVLLIGWAVAATKPLGVHIG